MEQQQVWGPFENISQRVVYSYIRSLATAQQGQAHEAAQRDLHAFFELLYAEMYRRPGLFGLPTAKDAWVQEGEPDHKQKLIEVNRLIDRPRKLIDSGLSYLSEIGRVCRLEGEQAWVGGEDYAALLAGAKVKPAFLQGLECVGLTAELVDGAMRVSNERFPHMLLALKALASACQAVDPPSLGRFHFARCDFRTMEKLYSPDALDLYNVFPAECRQYLTSLHHYMTGMGYKPVLNLYGIHAWEVKYQGNRKIKATPLFQVDFQERFLFPLLVFIKCASANRLVEMMPQQSQMLQEDFYHRTTMCQESRCDWCKNRKNLGPSLLKFMDQEKTVCWYVLPDISELNRATSELIKEYVQLHESLSR
jgi:hypothetical protein